MELPPNSHVSILSWVNQMVQTDDAPGKAMHEGDYALVVIVFAMMLFGILTESASGNFKPYEPPQITVLSPSPNGTCFSSSVTLNVRVQLFGQTPQSLEYLNSLNNNLDGTQDVPISFAYTSSYGPGYYLYGNGTLSDLSDGVHNLSVRAETAIGAEKKCLNATVSFTVKITNEPFSWPLVAVPVTAVAVVAAGVLVYWKKRRR